ncbi:hypothetical protein HK096_006391, partial [Nowakowskiella sp. JEL0078]
MHPIMPSRPHHRRPPPHYKSALEARAELTKNAGSVLNLPPRIAYGYNTNRTTPEKTWDQPSSSFSQHAINGVKLGTLMPAISSQSQIHDLGGITTPVTMMTLNIPSPLLARTAGKCASIVSGNQFSESYGNNGKNKNMSSPEYFNNKLVIKTTLKKDDYSYSNENPSFTNNTDSAFDEPSNLSELIPSAPSSEKRILSMDPNEGFVDVDSISGWADDPGMDEVANFLASLGGASYRYLTCDPTATGYSANAAAALMLERESENFGGVCGGCAGSETPCGISCNPPIQNATWRLNRLRKLVKKRYAKQTGSTNVENENKDKESTKNLEKSSSEVIIEGSKQPDEAQNFLYADENFSENLETSDLLNLYDVIPPKYAEVSEEVKLENNLIREKSINERDHQVPLDPKREPSIPMSAKSSSYSTSRVSSAIRIEKPRIEEPRIGDMMKASEDVKPPISRPSTASCYPVNSHIKRQRSLRSAVITGRKYHASSSDIVINDVNTHSQSLPRTQQPLTQHSKSSTETTNSAPSYQNKLKPTTSSDQQATQSLQSIKIGSLLPFLTSVVSVATYQTPKQQTQQFSHSESNNPIQKYHVWNIPTAKPEAQKSKSSIQTFFIEPPQEGIGAILVTKSSLRNYHRLKVENQEK